jgi:glyoxylase-like metal-dependent hydrolase (beta-lactamase superfamily II)
VREGDLITFGECALSTIHLVGHTPGSLVLGYDDPTGHHHLFTGDCLFPGGVGRTWSPEDFDSLYAGVVAKIFDHYDDETWIYPGHGDDTILGNERPHLKRMARTWLVNPLPKRQPHRNRTAPSLIGYGISSRINTQIRITPNRSEPPNG